MAVSGTRNVVICGSGPAGYTAALYLARANLSPLVLAGPEVGGQLTTTTIIENFPGFPEGRDGNELMMDMEKQVKNNGADVAYESARSLEPMEKGFRIDTTSGEIEALAVILATGASPRLLGLESEKTFWNFGVHTCAVCDGGFYRGKSVAVVGGGDSAMEEATYLAKLCDKVTVIHRRDELRASKVMADRALNTPKIDFEWNAIVDEVLGNVEGEHKKRVTGLRLRSTKDSSTRDIPSDAMFLAIGHTPNTEWVKGAITLDEQGYVVVDDRQRTNVKGVFAAGDVHDRHYRQAVTAAGYGCKAALETERYLTAEGLVTD